MTNIQKLIIGSWIFFQKGFILWLTSLFLLGSLLEFRRNNAGKKAKAAKEKEVKKRKLEEEQPGGGGERVEEDQDGSGDD